MLNYLPKVSLMVRFALLLSIVYLTACANFSRPSHVGAGWYLVKPTDTLYSIAWRYNVDFKTLASWNRIKAPFIIKPGQYVRLIKPKNVRAYSALASTKIIKQVENTKLVKKISQKPLHLIWPTKGKALNRFSFKDINKRGINIASKIRQPIVAVSDGKVVYSGNGLVGYKNLIIIKHNETYLSAYAQNKNLLVKEGEVVKKGKVIADMGADKVNGFLLHFQIRKNGKPIDPMLLLPKNK